MNGKEEIRVLPILPLKNSVLFPRILMPLTVGRPASIAAVEAALATEEKEIVVVAQRNSSAENPRETDLYSVGTKGIIRQMSRSGENALELIVVGVERVVILKLAQAEPYLAAKIRLFPLSEDKSMEVEALHRAVLDLAVKAMKLLQPQAAIDLGRMTGAEDPTSLTYLLASILGIDAEKEQALLEAATQADALRLIHSYLNHEVQVLELRSKITTEAQTEMSRQQREYLLRQQLRAIQQELGEKSPEQTEIQLLAERLEKGDYPEEVRLEVQREISRLEKLPSAAPDYHVTRTYVEFVLDLPWRTRTEDQLEISRARQILDEDHYDLKPVKERILEHLGVLKLNPQAKAPILCFVGPPGVGKTSLGHSIARSLGRKFERCSLGGMHDEAELRGHRRTYIGAMPGRLIHAIRRAGVNNPVIMLDEIDKLGRDFRGDPASALLEILDPEQNRTFHDNYLDIPFDLSRVLFITTANTLDRIERPLLDRMETLRLPGYSTEEKAQIATRYLIPRQIKETGLTPDQCQFTAEALVEIITGYTREAGLRQLERALGRTARKIALRYAEGNATPVTIRAEDLPDLLGPKPFFPEQIRKELPAGVAAGLAWTESGGDVLYVEATLLPDAKGLTLTGQLGEVMQESAKAAQSYIWSHAEELGIERSILPNSGVHIHVPSGAIPKDGPSAGITMAVAMVSAYTKFPVQSNLAMTGEITLTGLVLPIGGVKEKILAAHRAGIRRVILPKENAKDLTEIPDQVRQEIQLILVERIEGVLRSAIPQLEDQLTALKK